MLSKTQQEIIDELLLGGTVQILHTMRGKVVANLHSKNNAIIKRISMSTFDSLKNAGKIYRNHTSFGTQTRHIYKINL